MTPNNLLNKKYLISNSKNTSGNYPLCPNTLPTNLLDLVNVGSTFNPTPISPPGAAYNKLFYSANNETILENIGVHLTWPYASLVIIPGLISISSPTLSIPYNIDPPATPPFKLSISSPGLFISNDLITIIRGYAVKSLIGNGIYSAKY